MYDYVLTTPGTLAAAMNERRRRRQREPRPPDGAANHGGGGGQARLLDQDPEWPRARAAQLCAALATARSARVRCSPTPTSTNSLPAQTRKDFHVHLPQPRSPYWHYDFPVPRSSISRLHENHQPARSPKSRDRRAREGEATSRRLRRQDFTAADDMAGRCWRARAAYDRSADAWDRLRLLIKFFGKGTLLRHRRQQRCRTGGVAARSSRSGTMVPVWLLLSQ